MSYHPTVASRPIGATQANETTVAMVGIVITGALMTFGYFALKPPKRKRRRR